jgi:hypothetical protein
LRGLHQTERSSINRFFDSAVRPETFDRVGHGQHRDGRTGLFSSSDRPRDQVGAGEWPGSVVHQDNIGRARRKGLEACTHRRLPRRAAEDRGENSDVPRMLAHEVDVVLADNGLQRGDGRDAGKAQQRAAEQGRSSDFAELFGRVATCAQALTGGHHNSCDLRHLRLQDRCLYRVISIPQTQRFSTSVDEQFFAVQHLLCDRIWLKCVQRKETPKW